jgi:hypothetical protein
LPYRASIMEVTNLEAAFEKITVNDENEEIVSSSTATYHKSKVYKIVRCPWSCN